MVLEVPPKALGAIDDYWFRWVIDIGAAWARSRRGRQIPHPAARLRWSAARWHSIIARARTSIVVWFGSLVPGEQRSEAGGRNDQKVHQGLSIRGRRRGHPHRRLSERQALAGKVTPPPPTVFHEGTGKVMNTIPPNDFSYYEMLNEVVQQRACRVALTRVDGPGRRHRHHQGQTVRAGCADEEDSHRSAGARQCHLAHPVDGTSRSGLVLLPRFGLAEHAVRSRLRVRDADPAGDARGRQALPAHRLSHARRADGLLLRRHRDHARDGHAAARHRLAPTYGRWSMQTRSPSTAPRPTR